MLPFVRQLRKGQGCQWNLLQRICIEDFPKTCKLYLNQTTWKRKVFKKRKKKCCLSKSSFLIANGLVHILSARNSLKKTNSAFWWTKYFCTHLFRINNLRSDHSFAEAITDLYQINAVKNRGEGGGKLRGRKVEGVMSCNKTGRSKSDASDAFPASQTQL